MTLDLDAPAADMARIAAEIRDDQLDDPTPCPDIDVRGMLAHVLGLSVGFRATPPGSWRGPPPPRRQARSSCPTIGGRSPHRLSELWPRGVSRVLGRVRQRSVVSRHPRRRRPPSATTNSSSTAGTSRWQLASPTPRRAQPRSLLPAGVVHPGRPRGARWRSVRAEGPGERRRLSAGTDSGRRRADPRWRPGGPDLGVQEVLAAVQVTGIGTGREILPTAVGDDQHDVRGFTDASRPRA